MRIQSITVGGFKNVRLTRLDLSSSLDLRDRLRPFPLEYADEDENMVRFDDNDVPRALYRLKINNPERYSLFEEAVYTLFPEFTDIYLDKYTISSHDQEQRVTVAVGDKILSREEMEREIPFKIREHFYRMFVKCDYLNQPLSMAGMSMGTKRVIWLLANVFMSQSTGAGIIGIEEVETSIHPRMMRNLLEILAEAADGSALLISSHSPYLVQHIKPENIYIGIPNPEGTAFFRKIQKNKRKVILANARDLNLSAGEYIFELLSGDSDSYEVLGSYLEDGKV